jgi:hypothetical protein
MTSRTTMSEIAEKYPAIESEYETSWKHIVKESLNRQYLRNPKSSCVRTMKSYIHLKWPYLNKDELYTMVDRISGRFNNSRESPIWDEWRKLLPNVFNKDKINTKQQDSHNKISKSLNVFDISDVSNVFGEKCDNKKYYTVSKGDICIGNVSENDLFNILSIVANVTK